MTIEEPVINLKELGWDKFFIEEFRKTGIKDAVPGRVISQYKDLCMVQGEHGELAATISGRMRYLADIDFSYPVVGDWVVIKPQPDEQKGVIQRILPRKSKFSRQAPGGRTQQQVVAANIDIVFLVNGLDGGRNLNLRRLERYLTLAWNSGARPVVVLNKMDLCPDIKRHINDAERVAPGIPVHAISATERLGLDELRRHLTRGSTTALLGQSGVGKSAIINALLGEERLQVGAVREKDRKGRHTTIGRELIMLPGGGAVIDTPGLREIKIRGDEEGLKDTFEDIEQLVGQCRFSDCQHDNEPGCAVRKSIEVGTLDPARFESYRRLQRELRYQALRETGSVRQEERLRWKKISQWAKQIKKRKR